MTHRSDKLVKDISYYQDRQKQPYSRPIRELAKVAERDITELQNRLEYFRGISYEQKLEISKLETIVRRVRAEDK